MNTKSCYHTVFRTGCLSALLLFSSLTCADGAVSASANAVIEKLYQNLNKKPPVDMAERLDYISTGFIDRPYVLGALGEGDNGRYDQWPLYRVDGFDCETFVDTVLAIALANNLPDFQRCINRIRYRNGRVDYLMRNHFTSLDWNRNNQRAGYVKDITNGFHNKNNQSVALRSHTFINKPGWYQHHKMDSIKLDHDNNQQETSRLAELRSKGSQLAKTWVDISYVPLSALFDKQQEPDTYLFAQIPDASIIEIVRPNWNLEKQIGTNLDVSHLGFAFWKGETLMFRQASSKEKRVVDVPLIDYLKETLASPTIKGINVQVVVPTVALKNGCAIR